MGKGMSHMQESQIPIERYLAELASRLDMSAEERAAALLEVRDHLEELAASHQADGADLLDAQRQAVREFGNVRRLGRRLSAGRLKQWGGSRWARGIVIGALLSWAIWTIGVFPVMVYYYTIHAMMPPPDLMSAFLQSTPVASGAFYAYLTLGWKWVLPLLLLYALVPFFWGGRARQWWAPGLAYGLGTWLSMPWGLLYWFLWNSGDWAFQAESAIVLLALPLALVASLAGRAWRRERELRSALATAVTA